MAELGKGGSGKVFRVCAKVASNHAYYQVYALKVVNYRSDEELNGLREEVKTLELLNNQPHIIQLVDYEEDLNSSLFYMVRNCNERRLCNRAYCFI